FFFFSSRRRHTRSYGDWSSDVCSSDLGRLGCSECYVTFAEGLEGLLKTMHKGTKHIGKVPQSLQQSRDLSEKLKTLQKKLDKARSEERRVGKECRYRRRRENGKKDKRT